MYGDGGGNLGQELKENRRYPGQLVIRFLLISSLYLLYLRLNPLYMRKIFLLLISLFSLLAGSAQFKPFRFAFISDTHIGSPDGSSEEDLKRTVRDINSMNDIAFVVITGDITELGTNDELARAKRIFDSLQVKWYIIPGNHDSGWSESGGLMFTTVFGYDKFSFEYEGIKFLGCASGPYLRMSDGHVPRDAVNWLDGELKKLSRDQPVIFLNHYPINDQLDNWYEITDRLHQYNTQAILCGHGHTNKAFDFENIPGVMGRSNLRAKQPYGGYNLVDVSVDSIVFTERKPGFKTLPSWTSVKRELHHYDTKVKYPRPDFSVNDKYSSIQQEWTVSSPANIISTPVVAGNIAIAGNQQGEIAALSLTDGKTKWKFQAGGPVFSSPAEKNGSVLFGCTDGNIYCLNALKGELIWKTQVNTAVLGSPLISGDTVFIGGSGKFFAMDLVTGKQFWNSNTEGPVVSTPVLHNGYLFFGAWDTYFYCINARNGSVKWKWNNGSRIKNYSPASCIPAIVDGVVYIVAPDRYITAIDELTGSTLWRNNDATVRESMGISSDGKLIYGKTMQDTIVAYHTSREKQMAAWKLNCGFGYEHVPSMMVEAGGLVFFGTRSGVVYCIDPAKQQVVWAHKLDNSMINTVRPLSRNKVLVTTMDGMVSLLAVKRKMDVN